MSKQTRRTPTAGKNLAGWQARSLHTITLLSGQRVRIRIPGIATLLEHGDLPEDLADIALQELTQEGGATAVIAGELAASENGDRARALERMAAFGRFQRHIVLAAIAEVEQDGEFVPVSLDMTDTDALPENDLAMVAEIVQRLRFHDARGVRIGVEPLDRWAAFREAHGCPDADCEGCKKLVATLSSTHVGDV